MNHLKILCLLVPSIFMALSSMAVDMPKLNGIRHRIYMAYPVTSPPVIDGVLEESFWGNLPRAKYFMVNDAQTNSVSKQTIFRIAYDPSYLYVGAVMYEPSPELIQDDPKALPYKRDRINFIFSTAYDRKGTYQDSPYVFVMFEAGGTVRAFKNRLPAKVEHQIAIPAEWTTAYRKDSKHWYIEARIPFSTLGISPAMGEVFFNVRRDTHIGPDSEKETMWSQRTKASQGAHCFGTLVFNTKPGNPGDDTFWLNARPRFWFQTGRVEPIGQKKGEYVGAKLQFGALPGWAEAEALSEKIRSFFETNGSLGIRALLDDSLDETYVEWLQTIRRLGKTAPPKTLDSLTRDARIESVILNGQSIPLDQGKVMLKLVSGVNQLEILAEATGPQPGVKFHLEGSSDTVRAWTASLPDAAPGKILAEADGQGYLWQGKAGKLVFRQNLIWNREYCNHPLAFIAPGVRDWGVSPGETMIFLHKLFNPLKTGKPCDYVLIVDVPMGFTRINDVGESSMFAHYWTRQVSQETLTLNGKPYVRYTYRWKLPGTLDRGLACYTQFICFRHDSFKFAPGEKVDFRFRRVIDGNTTDLTNVIKVSQLPPIRGGRLKVMSFPQYHNFKGGRMSSEQWDEMLRGSVQAGLDVFMLQPPLPQRKGIADIKNRLDINRLKSRSKARNLIWVNDNEPLWGAGGAHGYLRALVEKTPELQARHFDEDGGYINSWFMDFCLTRATGTYREKFKQALMKDYQRMMKDTACKDFFINDENNPQRVTGTWTHSYCFCEACKEDFRKMFHIPATVKLDNRTIVTTYQEQWSSWWKHKHKNLLLQLTYEAIHEVGGTLSYYHTSSDLPSYREARGKYDTLFVTIPGCAAYTGSAIQATIDHNVDTVRKLSGHKNLVGQYRTYTENEPYSSDGYYFYPRETKMQLVRLAATLQKGAISECASYFSAGALYYAGEATRLIAAFEELFLKGTRAEHLVAGDFRYPNLLALEKDGERLILVFNEDHQKTWTGNLRNLQLKPGQKAEIYGQKETISNPSSMTISVPPQDVMAIHVK